MNGILTFLNLYAGIFLIIICIILIALLYQFLQINKKLTFQKRRYDMLLRGRVDLNLEELLKAHSSDIVKINEVLEELKKDIERAKLKTELSIQKVGFVKYDAFFDLKNKLSYSLALLDSFNNGVLFTTIYGRESCITYVKEIKNGKSSIELSNKEIDALRKAVESWEN